MRYNYGKIALVVFLLVGSARPAMGCVFNVRETGFVDLHPRLYQVFLYVDSSFSAADAGHYKEKAGRILTDSNVRFSVIDVGRTDEQTRQFWDGRSIPFLTAVSPDGQQMKLDANSFEQSLLSLVTSPKRKEIAEKVIKHYAVVLLLEGPIIDANRMARNIADSAVAHIAGKMDMMPKPIRRPPTLVTVPHSSFQEEKILLWSLGLNPDNMQLPAAAVIYGRARWLGPLFSGDHFTKQNLIDLLLVVGADCECGLDQKWLQGTMLPLRWELAQQQMVAGELGFDAENPYVRMEMMAIIRNSQMLAPHAGPLHGFPEFGPSDSLAGVGGQFDSTPIDTTVRSGKVVVGFTGFPLLLLGVVALLVVGAGMVILLRNRSRV